MVDLMWGSSDLESDPRLLNQLLVWRSCPQPQASLVLNHHLLGDPLPVGLFPFFFTLLLVWNREVTVKLLG